MNNDYFEKARVARQVGDTRQNPQGKTEVWTQLPNGKFDWRIQKKPKNGGDAGNQPSGGNQQPSNQDANNGNKPQPSNQQTPQQKQQPSGNTDITKMTHQELVNWAKQTGEKILSEIAGNKKVPTTPRQVAYQELKDRGADVSKIDTDGLDTGYKKKAAKVQYKNGPKVDIKLPTNYTVKSSSGKVKTLSSSQQAELYTKLADDKLLKILNNPDGTAESRHIAYEEAAARGIDESKINTKGSLQKFWNKKEQLNNLTNKNQSENEDDEDDEANYKSYTQPWLEGVDTEKIMQEFPNGDQGWRDPNDRRIQKIFNKLTTLSDRQKYDAFLDEQKRRDENYVPPVKQIQDLNAEYLDFLDGDASSFLISAGGAGVGKTWGFKNLCKLLDLNQFNPEVMKPGDGDYDWVIAPNIKSEKQLNEFLMQHNGKIILFDDNDAILTRQDMKAVMKTVNDNDPESRLFRNPETGQMTKFTGKIACITNKSLDSLSDDEDGKAVLSRAKKLEVKMTVEENLEILGKRYKSMPIDGLDLGKDEAKLREEAYQCILDFKDHLDPAKFTVRKFRDAMLIIQSVKRRNKFARTSALAAELVGTADDWKKKVIADLNKADNDELNNENEKEEFGEQRPTERLKKKIDKLKKKNPKLANELFGDAAADHFDDDSSDDDDETAKAIFNEMSMDEAENLLFN
jgi:hypothetical protein